MDLLTDDELERSAVVANCRMNRERCLVGSDGYDVEIGFGPLDFLRGRTSVGRQVAWLDLCCGTGRASIQAARIGLAEGWPWRSWASIWWGCSTGPPPPFGACG